jgi:hypothetical protein
MLFFGCDLEEEARKAPNAFEWTKLGFFKEEGRNARKQSRVSIGS